MAPPEKPRFFVVPDGATPAASAEAPTAPAVTVVGGTEILGPIANRTGFERAVVGTNIDNSKNALRVACSARTLLGAALDIRRDAARRSPLQFPAGVTPGQKTAEAAEAVLRAHVSEAVMGSSRPLDLRKAALRAAEELSSARAVAASVGLDVDALCAAYFQDAEDEILGGGSLLGTSWRPSNAVLALGGGVAIGVLIAYILPKLLKKSK